MSVSLSVCVSVNIFNKNIKMSSFKGSKNIQKKEGVPDRSVSDNQSSSVTLKELAMKARKKKKNTHCNFEFQHGSHTLSDINLVKLEYLRNQWASRYEILS